MAYKYKPDGSEQTEQTPEPITNIAGFDFYNSMRLTISGLLFEVTSHNRIYYCGDDKSLTTGLKSIKNTVFDISGSNLEKFFKYTGLDINTVKQCIGKKNEKFVDSKLIYEHINKLDLEYIPEGVW